MTLFLHFNTLKYSQVLRTVDCFNHNYIFIEYIHIDEIPLYKMLDVLLLMKLKVKQIKDIEPSIKIKYFTN